jgi:virginiamycin B lyase
MRALFAFVACLCTALWLLPAFTASDAKPAAEPAPGSVEPERETDGYTETPSSQYLGLLPDGETKRRFILDCTGCHQFDPTTIGVDGRLKSHAEWTARTQQMLAFAGAHTSFPVMAPSRDAGETADWLTTHLGDAQPIPALALPEVETDPSVRFTEYDLPAPQDLPHDLVLDPEGRLVITGQLSGLMYVLDPETGAFSQRSIPVPNANPRALSVDAYGIWWVLLGGPEQIARFDPAVEAWETWPIGMHPHSIVREEDGRIWFNGHFSKSPEQIGVLDPATGDVTTYDVPSTPMPDGGSTIPYGLRRGPDGMIWGTQLVGNRLMRFDPATERFTLYDLPTSYSGPRRLDVAPDGTVWIPQYAAGKLARFDPATETFREYDLPIDDALPYIVRVDAERGWVWIATSGADALLRFFPDEERFTVHPLPTPRSIVRHLDLDPATGTLWLSYGNFPATHPKIVKAEVITE